MADSTVAITAGSGTSIRTITNAGVDSGAHQQVVSLADSTGTVVGTGASGGITVDNGASSLLFEAFDGTLGNQWTTGGTAPTQANGLLTFNAGTTASATSYITSTNPLGMNAESYLHAGFVLALDTNAAQTNSTRWWGYGQNAAGPTATAPVQNGVVFMLDYSAGTFYGAAYSAGGRSQVVTLTKPTDGAQHRYQILFRTTKAIFVVDGVTVGTINAPNPAASNNLFLIMGQANYTTGPAAVGTMQVSVASAADEGDNNSTISDATFPSVRANVLKGSTAATSFNTALVVALHPTSNTPTINSGANIIGGITQITTSVTPGTAAANLGKAAAATPSTTDTGVAPLFVRAPTTPVARTATAGNYSLAMVDQEGKQIVTQYADPANTWRAVLTQTTTTAGAVRAAQAAGIRNYVTGVTVSNSSATATLVTVLDGATVMWQTWLAAGASVTAPFETPLQGTAATAVNVNLSAAVTSVYVAAQGYIGL